MPSTIDQKFIEYIASTIVANPDDVVVDRSIDEKGVLLELYVNPDDLGRVIGRGGSTAKSMRTLLRALGMKNDARYNLKIIDTGEPGNEPPEDTSTTTDNRPGQDSEEETDEDVDNEDTAPAEEEEPAEEDTEEEEPEKESTVSKHREDIDSLTDLDI